MWDGKSFHPAFHPSILPCIFTFYQYRRIYFSSRNRKAEFYAFGRRLNETFDEKELNTALTHQSYVEKEKRKREDIGLARDDTFNIEDNAKYIIIGM